MSAASVWEVSIKWAAGRLRAPPDLVLPVESAGFTAPLPITISHAEEGHFGNERGLALAIARI